MKPGPGDCRIGLSRLSFSVNLRRGAGTRLSGVLAMRPLESAMPAAPNFSKVTP